MKKLPSFRIDTESTDKVLPLHQYLYLKFLDNETTALWLFFSLILLILLKFIVVGYSNGNESFTDKLFSNYGPLNTLFHFFRYLIRSIFHETFVKTFMKKPSFFSSNFKNPFWDGVCYWKLGCLILRYCNGPLNIR